ncbi:MAG: hypothetical protein ACI3XG_09535 [Faecousia sp.]
MRFVELKEVPSSREILSVFGGYNGNCRIGAGEFAAMENLCSDHYPLLSSRRKRGVFAQPKNAQGLIARDSLCWVDGSKFVVNGYEVEMNLSEREEDCPKRLVSMGVYVVIFPDKKYINTLDLTDFGNLEAEFTTEGTVTLTPAAADGTLLLPAYRQPEEPQEPENMALWLDTSQQPPALLQWSAGTAMWISVDTTFVKLSAPGIGAAFREGDGVSITGAPEQVAAQCVISCRDTDYLVVSGLLEEALSWEEPITVSRVLPEMDFVIECDNRLWGCRYGPNRQGEIVNEIYASKLGDFKNWSCFQGVTTDSYAMSLGAEGPFTGAIAHMGYPLFFRENCLHKIYGNYPANYRLQTTPCRGVQRGSEESLAIVGEVLYYKSPTGVCGYDGALPVDISMALAGAAYRDAAAGAQGGKYYISMADAEGAYHLFVYDTVRNLWHREDGTHARCFCSCREELYFLDDTGRIIGELGTGTPEEEVAWMAQTGDLGTESPDNKYLSRLTLRLYLAPGATAQLSVRYDEETVWHPLAQLQGGPMGSVTVPAAVRRCDHLRLRLEGTGDMRLYDLTRTLEQGSDVF